MDYSKLSYSVKKKTDKVCELKVKKVKWSHLWKIAVGVSVLMLTYIFLYAKRYASYTNSAFENQNLGSSVRILDIIILIAFAALVLIVYWAVGEYVEVKEAYEKTRIDLIKTINSKFCTCKGACDCKDEYVKDMEVRGIDLIYL